LAIRGPYDAGNDNDAEDLDTAPSGADGLIEHRFKGLERVHIVHVRASGRCTIAVPYPAPKMLPEPLLE
jgi:hypothetical protein